MISFKMRSCKACCEAITRDRNYFLVAGSPGLPAENAYRPQPVVIIDARITMKRHGVGMRAAFGSMLLFFLVETSYKGAKLTGDASETG